MLHFHKDSDLQFAPFFKWVNRTVTNEEVKRELPYQYMYMGHENLHDRTVYHYKHIYTRKYLYLTKDGQKTKDVVLSG